MARGQSMFGTFGHGGSALRKDGKLHGSIPPYGPVLENAAGINLAVAFMNTIPMEVRNPVTLIGIPDGATPQPAAMTEFLVASPLKIAGSFAGTYGGKDSIATTKMPANFTGPGMVTIGDASPTTTTVARPPAPLQAGKAIVFTAAVTGTAPTGNVAFFADGKRLGEAPLKDGTASFSTDKLPAGWQIITAGYEGNAANIPSLSATLDLEITP